MSSMFKKRTGGPAFKPKIGPRGPRAPAGATASSATASTAAVVSSPAAQPSTGPDPSSGSGPSVSPTPPPSSDRHATPSAPALAEKLQALSTPPESSIPHVKSREPLGVGQAERQSSQTPSQSQPQSPAGSESQPQPSLAPRPRIRPRLMAKTGASTTTNNSISGITRSAANNTANTTATTTPLAAAPHLPSSPSQTSDAPLKSQDIPAQTSPHTHTRTSTSTLPLNNSPPTTAPIAPYAPIALTSASADSISHNNPILLPTPEPSQQQPPSPSALAPSLAFSPEPSSSSSPLFHGQPVPSIDSLPELQTTVSTPTATDDSQPTPADSTNVSIAGSDAGGAVASTAPAITRKRKISTPDQNSRDVAGTSSKRPRKPRATIEVDDDVTTTSPATTLPPDSVANGDPLAATAHLPRRRTAASGIGSGRRRRVRSQTPPNSENQLVDLQKLTMADLTRDLRIGKKFSRHEELKLRERRARCKSGREPTPDGNSKDKGDSGSPAPGAGPSTTSSSSAATSKDKSSSSDADPTGPKFFIVDGQIVLDQGSLVVDRHAHAAVERKGMKVVEEHDFSRHITSNSFRTGSKLRGPNHWTMEDTEKFYHALKMFGTDFQMISNMFPGRTRRHVKMKFNREERLAPTRINAALVGEKHVKMDIAEYKATTGIEYESVESIQAEQQALAAEHEAEERRMVEDQESEMRRRREELFRDDEKPPVDENGITTIVDSGEGPVYFGAGPSTKGSKR
ncbi:Transcription factor TFIIIB component B'' [Ceratocystis lukuohia]|uniref:Transcription factor TFIIIB component B n=1 Tax=Ceratocystis lukuohia TaxID=2019550 RepID=A0ABR4MBH7_9PEZI